MPSSNADLDLELLHTKVHAIGRMLTKGLGKVSSRFVEDMLTGMLIGGSVRLTAIARALDESIPLHSTHKRLSRNLGNPRIGEVVAANLLEAGAQMLRDDSLLVIDVFELVKQYAEKMEYLAASPPSRAAAPGSPRASQGRSVAQRRYQVCEIFGWDIAGGPMPGLSDQARELATQTPREEDVSAWNNLVVTPLAQTLFSTNAPGFRSQIDEILELVRRVDTACHGRGVFAIDTVGLSGIRPELARHSPDLLTVQRDLPEALAATPTLRFAARVAGDYELLHGRGRISAKELGESCQTPYGVTLYKHRDDAELGLFIHFGAVQVRLPACPDRSLWLVAVKGLTGERPTVEDDWDPFLILTTEPMRRNREVLWHLVWSFLSYWDAIQTNQAIKGQFDFDDVRVLSYDRLRSLGSLVVAASFVEAQWPGITVKTSLFRTPRSRSHYLFRSATTDDRQTTSHPA